MIPNYTPRARTDFLAVHCSDTPPSMDIGEATIRQWHLERGWIDIGYNIIVRRDGMIEIGRPLDYRGAHVAGYNHRALGICLVGGRKESSTLPECNFTELQFESLILALQFCWRYAPNAIAKGHRDFPGVQKACPSFDVWDFLERVGYAPDGVRTD